jgi:uncharacterized protein
MPVVKMPRESIKIIIDSNIWISFAIGKRMEKLRIVIDNPQIIVYSCTEIIMEFNNVARRQKLKKYLSENRINEVNEIISLVTVKESPTLQLAISRDVNDNYLLSLAQKIQADYLITGDFDLLVLERFENTQIVNFNQFLEIIEQ